MSEFEVARIQADPKRPWKAIAAGAVPALIAFLTVLLNDGRDMLPAWALLLIAAVLAALATFVVSNPLVSKTTGRHIRGDHGQAGSALLIALAAIAIIGLALLLTGVLDVRGR